METKILLRLLLYFALNVSVAVHTLHTLGSMYTVISNTRNIGSATTYINEFVKSEIECAIRCSNKALCNAVNFITATNGQSVCEFIESRNNTSLVFEENTMFLYVDEGSSSPCLNGGTFLDIGLGYTCTCRPGYQGNRCEENIDECATFPCQNGATCTDAINTYSCQCADGFNGTRCETNLCTVEPCWTSAELMVWRGHEYYFSTNLATQTNSVGLCESIGSQLLVISSDAEALLIADVASDGIWIGLVRNTNCNTLGCLGTTEECTHAKSLWSWIDGSTNVIMNSTYWESNKPACVGGRSCVRYLGGLFSRWRSEGCYHNFKRICKKPVA